MPRSSVPVTSDVELINSADEAGPDVLGERREPHKGLQAVQHRRQGRLGVGAMVAVAVVGVAMVGTARLIPDDERRAIGTPDDGLRPPSTVGPDEATARFVWEEASTVIGGAPSPDAFWTGEELLVINSAGSGSEVVGERWDPDSNQAVSMAPSGLTWRTSPAMAWTGEELLIAGGGSGVFLDPTGAAYDPAADTWREIAPPSESIEGLSISFGGPAFWTGDEMIAWWSGLAYDPATDTWREIALSPFSSGARPTSVWTGSQLVVWDGCEGARCDDLSTGLITDGAIYHPVRDDWTALPAAPMAPAANAVGAWTGREVLLVVTGPGAIGDDEVTAAAFDLESGTWRTIAPWPLPYRSGASTVWTGDRLVVWGGCLCGREFGNDGASYDPLTDQWTVLPGAPGPGRSFASIVYTGDVVYVSGSGPAPPLVLTLP